MADSNNMGDRPMSGYLPHAGSPIREMMGRFFADDTRSALGRRFSWIFENTDFPKVDISENRSEITVIVDVPGIDRENISVEVFDDMLTISGSMQKVSREGKPGEKYYRYERDYGKFNRTFALPAKVLTSAMTMSNKNGVLTVIIPKDNASGSRKKSTDIQSLSKPK